MGDLKRSLVCLLGFLAFIALAPAQNILKDYVLAGDVAVGVKPPIPISSPGVQTAAWSSDGRYVLITSVRQSSTVAHLLLPTYYRSFCPDEDSQVCISIWDSRTLETHDLLSLPARSWLAERVVWLNGIDVAYVTLSHSEPDADPEHRTWVMELCQIDADRRLLDKVVSLSSSLGSPSLWVEPSPNNPIALLAKGQNWSANVDEEPPSVIVLDPQRGQRTEIASENLRNCAYAWSTDGKTPYAYAFALDAAGKTKPKYYELSFNEGKVTPLDKVPRTYKPEVKSYPVNLRQSTGGSTSFGTSTKYQSLWLAGSTNEEPREVLVAAGVDRDSAVSPFREMILYVSNGVAMVRPLVSVEHDLFVQARRAAERQDAVQRAKLIGISYQMYATDYDGETPKTNEDYISRLSPYAKYADVMENLVLTWQGNLNTLVDPAKTVVGYIPTASGKALLYADAHVVWQDKP